MAVLSILALLYCHHSKITLLNMSKDNVMICHLPSPKKQHLQCRTSRIQESYFALSGHEDRKQNEDESRWESQDRQSAEWVEAGGGTSKGNILTRVWWNPLTTQQFSLTKGFIKYLQVTAQMWPQASREYGKHRVATGGQQSTHSKTLNRGQLVVRFTRAETWRKSPRQIKSNPSLFI